MNPPVVLPPPLWAPLPALLLAPSPAPSSAPSLALSPASQSPSQSPPLSAGRTRPEPQLLHPAVWRAQAGARAGGEVLASGHAALDAELPGGGWPLRALTELLLAGPGQGELRLLAPALARVARQGRAVMLLGPPAELSAEAWAQLGLPPAHCIVVRIVARPEAGAARAGPRRRRPEAELGWALEQALRSGQAGAVLAWAPPGWSAEALRRLQLAAQAHAGPAFLLREPAAATQPSPAPLRLALQASGPDGVALRLLKRRGPALAQPLWLALPPVLSPRGLARAAQPWPAAPAGPVGSAPCDGATGAGGGQGAGAPAAAMAEATAATAAAAAV